MSKSAVKPVPDCMHTVTPHIICKNAIEAIDFYKRAFNAVETRRLMGPDGGLMHAEIRIGDSMIMLTEENLQWGNFGPTALKGSPITIHLAVENVDAVVAQAEAAGAKVLMPVSDMFWGDRYGRLTDPFGHYWSVATHIRDLNPEEMHEAMMAAVATHPCGKD